MSTTIADPVQTDPNVRVINGRQITRVSGGRWMELETVAAYTSEHIDQRTGVTSTIDHPARQTVLWQAWLDPMGEVEALGQEGCNWRVLDAREPSALHAELDQARAAGYATLVEEFHARNKVKPRTPLVGVPLGTCYRSHGTAVANVNDDGLREMLKLHANGDWGSLGKLADVTLDDDMKWCPVLFPAAVQNAVAIERGSGLVRSVYPKLYEKTKGDEVIKVTTLIGQATYIYIPTRDAMS